MLYHLVFSTKDREPWIDPAWRPELHAYIGGVVRNRKGQLLAAGRLRGRLGGTYSLEDAVDAIRHVLRDGDKRIGRIVIRVKEVPVPPPDPILGAVQMASPDVAASTQSVATYTHDAAAAAPTPDGTPETPPQAP